MMIRNYLSRVRLEVQWGCCVIGKHFMSLNAFLHPA